jgi:hypothetical protein
MNWYKKAKKWNDTLRGGRGDYKSPDDFKDKSVEKGVEIEMEHTNNPDLAKEITIDHLTEFDDYYDKKIGLPALEKKLKKVKKARGPRYPGQLQGDESRSTADTFTGIIDDNETVEGEYVKILHRMFKEKRLEDAGKYIAKLKENNSINRVNSMITRAMYGVKL